MASSSRGKDIQAAGAYVRLYMKGGEWEKGLKSASEKLNTFKTSVQSAAKRLAIAGGAIGAPLVASLKVYMDMGSELQDVSDRLGIATDTLSELRFAADQSGSNIEDLEKAIRKLLVTVSQASGGNPSAIEALRSIGLSASNFDGKSASQSIELVATALSKMPNVGQRTEAALGLLGKSASSLLPLLSSGAEGINELREQAVELGLSISPKSAAAAEKLGDAMQVVGKQTSTLAYTVGEVLEPAASQLAATFSEVVPVITQIIKRNQGLVIGAALLSAALFASAGALGLVGSIAGAGDFALNALHTTIGATRGAFSLLASAAALAVSPIGLVTVLVGSVVGAAFAASGALVDLANGWIDLRNTATKSWKGIVGALAGGDIKLAGEIATAGLELAWLQTMQAMKNAWTTFGDFLSSYLNPVIDGIVDQFTMMSANFTLGLVAVESTWANLWANISSQTFNVINKLALDIGNTWDSLWSYLTLGVKRFSAYFLNRLDDFMIAVNKVNISLSTSTNAKPLEARNKQLEDRKAARTKDAYSSTQSIGGDLEKRAAERAAIFAEQSVAVRNDLNRKLVASEQEALGKLGEITKARMELQQTLDSMRDGRANAGVGNDPAMDRLQQQIDDAIKNLAILAKKGIDTEKLTLDGMKNKLPGTDGLALNASGPKTTGVFSPYALRGISGGTTVERIAKATEKTAKNTAKIKEPAFQ